MGVIFQVRLGVLKNNENKIDDMVDICQSFLTKERKNKKRRKNDQTGTKAIFCHTKPKCTDFTTNCD